MSNTKTVFKTDELPHIWVHRRAPQGRCASNVSFVGETYYSYATPIARLLEGKGGDTIVVLNETGYSSTTGKHQGALRRAVGHLTRFSVHGLCRGEYNGLPHNGKELRDWFLKQYEHVESRYNSEVGKQEVVVSRYAHVRARTFLGRVYWLDEAIRVCKYFALPGKALEKKRSKLQGKIDEANKILEAKEQRRKELEATRAQRHREAAIVTARKWLEDPADTRIINPNVFITQEPELAAKCEEKNNHLIATKAERWKAGDKNVNFRFYDNLGIILLRQEGEEIVTTMGARFPVEHGKKAFAMVLKCRLRGQGFTNNGHSIRVGHYTIDRIDSDGTVHAGCHHIQYEELTSLAVRMKWMDESHQPIDQEIREIACTP